MTAAGGGASLIMETLENATDAAREFLKGMSEPACEDKAVAVTQVS